MYLEALHDLVATGEYYTPRAKKIQELRPVCFQFLNPLKRVTFLKGRRINPFFQLAEVLWIFSGRADVEWLSYYNKNMISFSDDGRYFNAPYGERLRRWNQSCLRNFIFNPYDQLYDVYEKIVDDRDTRQAVALLWNPLFDSYSYVKDGGKDLPCNIALTFKVRNEKLDLTVFNRSNDLHWGLFGANLPQFSSILELMASWLRLDVGVYTHITDSLHIYLEDYGSQCTQDILNNNSMTHTREIAQFFFKDEPRITCGKEGFEDILTYYWEIINRPLHSDRVINDSRSRELLIDTIDTLKDEYIKHIIQLMLVYRVYKLKMMTPMIDLLSNIKDSQWKIACLRFIYDQVEKQGFGDILYKKILSNYENEIIKYIRNGA